MKKSASTGGAMLRRAFRLLSLVPLALASGGALAQVVPNPGEMFVEGVLTRVVGDPEPGSGQRSQRIFLLNADDGNRFELSFAGAMLPADGVHPMLNKRIQVTAPAVDLRSMPVGGAIPLQVLDARPLQVPPQPLKWGVLKAIGTQPYISLLCKFADIPTEPRTQAYFQTQLGLTSPGFDHYFRETSYNLLNLSGSAVTAWAFLPQPRSYYMENPPGSGTPRTAFNGVDGFLDLIFSDCTAAHNATVNFAAYYGMNIMLNGTLNNAAWGGGKFATLDGTSKGWPTTWMPYHGEGSTFGWRSHGVLAHELSHAFGAPHSESPDGDEYGSEWDVVSSPGATCATVDANYGCLGQHMNAYAKTLMQNIAAARIATHNTGTTTYDVERLAQPPGVAGTHQMIRVNIPGTSTRWYTVESRLRMGYDTQLMGDGVIIHEINTARANDARLVYPGQPATGVPTNYGGLAALWQPGMSFASSADNVRITINSISSAGTANITVAPFTAVADAFPPACALPAGWTVPTGSTAGWAPATDTAAGGTCSLKSAAMANPPNDGVSRARAAIEYTGAFSAGNITFWAKVSSQPGRDCLRFTIDGAQQNVGSCSIGGGMGLTPGNPFPWDTGWRFFSIPVTAGTHTVRWTYEKDAVAQGHDAAWIDSVTFPTAPVSADLVLSNLVTPSPGSTGKDVVFTMSATNNGPAQATGVVISMTYDPTASLIWLSPGCAGAGGSTINCTIGTLNNGATSQAFKLVLRKNVAGTINNNATVTGTTTDANAANNTVNRVVTIDASTPGVPVQRYRLYSPISLEHHFTTDLNEYNVLGGMTGAWIQEGGVGKVLNNPGTYNGVAAVPYYRLYDTTTTWHHWTTDANEYYTLGLFGWWSQEGVDGYILPTQAPGTIQLYRLNYAFIPTLHHWTIDQNEYTTLICCYGWAGEGGSGFVIP